MKYESLIKIKNLLPVFLLLIILSCVPEDGLKNPADYEDYISISSDQTPAVSPDGEWIAYYHLNLEYPEPEEYLTGLYVMDKTGNNRRLLLEGQHFQPDWSPDGKWLVFSSSGILQIIDFEGDSIRTFEGIGDLPLFSPDWSNDGESIIFSAPITIDGGVFLMTPDFDEITHLLKPVENNGMYASFSPDDQNILYERGNQSFLSVEIFSLELTTMVETRLTDNDRDERHSSWSPTNKLIAYSSDVRIYRMDTKGSNQKQLDFGQYPAWTPDGKFIVYSNANGDFSKEVLWKIDVDGNNKIQLTF